MPTVHGQDGFRLMIYPNDHRPAHVHCIKAGAAVLIEIETLTVRKNYGMPANEIHNAVRLVEANAAKLMTEWRKVFPS